MYIIYTILCRFSYSNKYEIFNVNHRQMFMNNVNKPRKNKKIKNIIE